MNQATIAKIKEIQKVSGEHWDELVDAMHDKERGHNHDGRGSRKVSLPPVQYMVGSSPIGLMVLAEGKRVVTPYGTNLYFEHAALDELEVYFEVCAKTSAGVARARLFDLTAKEIVQESLVELHDLEKRNRGRHCTINKNHEYEVQFVTDIGNMTTIYGACVLLGI